MNVVSSVNILNELFQVYQKQLSAFVIKQQISSSRCFLLAQGPSQKNYQTNRAFKFQLLILSRMFLLAPAEPLLG